MENFIGEIRLFAGNFAPSGWSFCDGSLLQIANNDALYALLGTTYGGDGQTTFALPNLLGRIPVGQGTGSGLSSRPIGQSSGEEGHTLNVNEMASHAHGAVASTANATTVTAGSSVLYGAVQPDTPNNLTGLYTAAADAPTRQMNAAAIGNTGGNQPHDNTMNTLTINYIIALDGIYPSQQ